MFQEMRLKGNQTTQEEAEAMLKEAASGVLALQGKEPYPYAVPVNFVYHQGKIYFHSTLAESHKLTALRENPKVSFCVITKEELVPSAFNTLYRSAIAFGTARILRDRQEILTAIHAILKKYSPDHLAAGEQYLEAQQGKFCVVEISVDHLTGKFGN